ncbi:MAG: hypothetical protein WC284_09775 [Candidimonas sp.]
MRTFSIFSIPADMPASERLKRRHMLARMGLALLVMMQVMMFAFPGYLRSRASPTDNLVLYDQALVLMNWISLVLTVPVVLYCAWPVWQGSWRQLRRGRIGMDVPVALGIAAAFLPSVYATWAHRGEVYFDSVTMFVAFLLTARYLELCARQSVTVDGSHGTIEDARRAVTGRADTLAFWFVAVQLALAFLAAGGWYLYISPERALSVMIAMLVMSCPCAMAMSVPTAVASAHAALVKRPAASPAEVNGLAAATDRVARQNLYGSVAWHLLMTPLAAAGLVAPWVAAVTMLLSSLAVVANSLRLFRGHSRADAPAWNKAAA